MDIASYALSTHTNRCSYSTCPVTPVKRATLSLTNLCPSVLPSLVRMPPDKDLSAITQTSNLCAAGNNPYPHCRNNLATYFTLENARKWSFTHFFSNLIFLVKNICNVIYLLSKSSCIVARNKMNSWKPEGMNKGIKMEEQKKTINLMFFGGKTFKWQVTLVMGWSVAMHYKLYKWLNSEV